MLNRRIRLLDEPTIVTDNLIGYWHYNLGLNGTAWNNLAPSTIGTRNGVITNATLVSDGLSFSGNGYVTVSGFSGAMSELSVEVVVSLNSATTGQNILGMGTQMRIWNYYNSSDMANAGITGTISTEDMYSKSLLNSSQFYMITLTWKTSGQTATVYVNGQQVRQGVILQSSPTTSTLYFGGIFAGGSLNGKIKSVKIYNKTLTQAEVSTNYNIPFDTVGLP